MDKTPMPPPLEELLDRAMAARAALFDAAHESAFRLFNGFSEGCPDLVIDLYASTLVLYDHAEDPDEGAVLVRRAVDFLTTRLNWLRAGIAKTRNAANREDRNGRIVFGQAPDTSVREHGIWYAVQLQMNRDAGLYLDTRNLRKWLIDHMAGRVVLNTFAYTGSLGVASLAGGASRVIQHDLKRRFLDVARASYTLNGFKVRRQDFIALDFFSLAARLKRAGELFDCVILDPPFFSLTAKGRVDQVNEAARLINKVRPLVQDGGQLIVINNALYVSGQDYMATLEALSKDGYLAVQELIAVPEDFTGFPGTRRGMPPVDPSPFNHSTKIAVLEIRRKQN